MLLCIDQSRLDYVVLTNSPKIFVAYKYKDLQRASAALPWLSWLPSIGYRPIWNIADGAEQGKEDMAKASLAPEVSPPSDIAFSKVKSKILSQGPRANETSVRSLLCSLKQNLYERSAKSATPNLLGFQVFIMTHCHHPYPVSPNGNHGVISFRNLTFPSYKNS